jgi:two-component sensor histidine kinase
MCFDGSVIWMRDTSRAVRDEQGHLLYYEGMIEDITEKKLADEQIRKSLAEKELLLKEIHHRVKNNLQVICSLLSLQSGYVTDRKALAMFHESQDRVRSMALVHERLYQSQDLARIDFAEYVRSLVAQLVHAYGSSSGPVAIQVNVKDVLFGIDEAVSCGLIINELVSNSLKHAFPQRRGGEIEVTVDYRNGEYVLSISDNGIGLAEDLHSRKAEGLGLQLVSTLTEQLGGTIEVTSGEGTHYRISFPERGR